MSIFDHVWLMWTYFWLNLTNVWTISNGRDDVKSYDKFGLKKLIIRQFESDFCQNFTLGWSNCLSLLTRASINVLKNRKPAGQDVGLNPQYTEGDYGESNEWKRMEVKIIGGNV